MDNLDAVFLGSRHSDVTSSVLPHAHDFYELNFLVSGRTKMRLNHLVLEYDTYDFILIPPGISHILYESAYDRFDNFVIWFRSDSLSFSEHQIIKLHDYEGAVRFLCSEIYRLYRSSGTAFEDIINAYLHAVLLHMRRGLLVDTTRQQSDDPVGKAIAYINENFLRQKVTVAMVAAELRMAPAYFTRLFRRRIGIPPVKFIAEMRIAEAKRMLAAKDMPVQEIARALFYEDPLYFFRQFSTLVGVSPSQYRKQFRNGDQK